MGGGGADGGADVSAPAAHTAATNGAAPAPPTTTALAAPSPSSAPPPATTTTTRPPPVVFVFDLDECLVLLDSLRNGAHAAAIGATPDVAAGMALVGSKLAAAVLEAADTRLSFAALEKGAGPPPATLDEAVARPPPAGPAYAAVAAEVTAGGRRGVLTPDQAVRAAGLRAAADGLTGGWLAAAGRLLAGLQAAGGAVAGCCSTTNTNTRPVTLALVSAGHLLPTLAKLSIFGLASLLPAAAVLSSRACEGGKAGAFGRLADEHGPGATFVVVGDGPDEESAARDRGWAFVRVGPVAAGGEFGGGDVDGGGLRPDVLGRQATPLPRLTVLDMRRAAGLV
jgi:hypothetical protein